ncbi:MAG: hypothetical protein EXS32_11055 [Opitutus sp.]|nr:hypothetical protein [Opitutus sp.]
MKITRIIFGLLLAAGAHLLAGAATKEVLLSTPARKEPPSLSDKPRGSAPTGPEIDSGRRGGLEDTVEIVGVTEEKPDVSGRRKVTVRVRYVLVHYPKGVLSLGFNLKSATQFVQVTNRPVMAGEKEIEMTATIVPVTWPKAQPFKVYVGLSAEPHPGQWSLLVAKAQVLKPIAAPAPPH